MSNDAQLKEAWDNMSHVEKNMYLATVYGLEAREEKTADDRYDVVIYYRDNVRWGGFHHRESVITSYYNIVCVDFSESYGFAIMVRNSLPNIAKIKYIFELMKILDIDPDKNDSYWDSDMVLIHFAKVSQIAAAIYRATETIKI